jgi:DNA-directed RNA polymerase specialized sigma24 family protein
LTAASETEQATSAETLGVRRAVESLPDDLRELVVLVHWDGFTVPEAAQLLHVRESTARGRYQRARIRLRAALENLPPDQAIPRENEARSNR